MSQCEKLFVGTPGSAFGVPNMAGATPAGIPAAKASQAYAV